MLDLQFKNPPKVDRPESVLFSVGSFDVWVPKIFVCGDRDIQIPEDFSFTTRTRDGKPHRKYIGIELQEEYPDAITEL